MGEILGSEGFSVVPYLSKYGSKLPMWLWSALKDSILQSKETHNEN